MNEHLNIPNQLPGYVTEKYPKFVEFIQTYYKFFQTQQIDLATAKDAEVSTLLENIRKEYAPKLDLNGLTDVQKRLIVQKISDFYKSKGSIDSIKFLLSMMYGAESEIILPSELLFKPSSAKWNRDISLRFRIDTGLLSSFGGFEATIIHDNIETKVNVIRVERVAANYYEAFIESEFSLNIVDGGRIVSDSFTGTLQKTTIGYKVLVPGQGFRVGDIFDIEPQTDDAPTRIRVKRTTTDSGIRHIEFVKFGSGFTTDFQYQIYAENQLNLTPNNLSIQVTGDQTLNVSLPSDDAVNQIKERLLMSRFTYFQSYDYTENPTYTGQVMTDTVATTVSELTVGEGAAVVTFILGYVLEYPGYYSTNEGFPSDSSYLQDGDYYQQFSYVIKTDRQVSEFGNVIKELAHPAGLKMFGEFTINNQIDIYIEIQNILNAINTAYIDTVLAMDSVDGIQVIKSIVDDLTVLTDYAISLEKGTIVDNAGIQESANKTYTKVVEDVQSVTESIANKLLNKDIQESVTIAHFEPKTFSKVVSNLVYERVVTGYESDGIEMNVAGDLLNIGGGFTIGTAGAPNYLVDDNGDYIVEEAYADDVATVAQSGGVILNPYYSSLDLMNYGVPYWSYGYTVNERRI